MLLQRVGIKVSKKAILPIIDVSKSLLKRSSILEFYKSIIPDGIHPNQIGHYLSRVNKRRYYLKFYEFRKVCK